VAERLFCILLLVSYACGDTPDVDIESLAGGDEVFRTLSERRMRQWQSQPPTPAEFVQAVEELVPALAQPLAPGESVLVKPVGEVGGSFDPQPALVTQSLEAITQSLGADDATIRLGQTQFSTSSNPVDAGSGLRSYATYLRVIAVGTQTAPEIRLFLTLIPAPGGDRASVGITTWSGPAPLRQDVGEDPTLRGALNIVFIGQASAP
jgi:hypothetical protein